MKKLIAVAMVAAMAGNVFAVSTLNVPSEYATIALAQEAAKPGDTILLAPGTYDATGCAAEGFMITLEEGVTLKGAGATPADCVITGGGTRQVLSITSAEAVVENLTLADGCGVGSTKGAGYTVQMTGGLVTNCVVSGGTPHTSATFETAVYATGGRITGCEITGVSAGTKQRATVYLKNATMDHCDVCNNSALHKYLGLVTVEGADGLVEFCKIHDNALQGSEYAYRDGALAVTDGATVRDSEIYNNTMAHSGNSYYTSAAVSTIGGYGITAKGNSNGGAVVERCIITNNVYRLATDGANSRNVYMTAGVMMGYKSVLRNCLVAHNANTTTKTSKYVWPVSGGVVMTSTYGSGARIENCTIVDNAVSLLSKDPNLANGWFVAGAVTNTIIRGAFRLEEGATTEFAYSCTDTLMPGEGNVAGDPLFTDAAACDYTIGALSPATDTGCPDTDVAVDLRGIARPKNFGVDMGCYECEYAASYSCSILGPTERFLGPSGGTLPFDTSVSMVKLVSAYRWTVTSASGDLVAEGAEKQFSPVFPAGEDTYTVSLKVIWSDGHEETAPVSVTVRAVSRIDVAPGDNLVSVLGALTEISADNPVTVQLAAGTYTAANSGVAEDAEWMFTLEDGVILKGAGTDATVLDGELAHRVLRLKAGSRARNLTVANAHSLGDTVSLRGYALDVNGATVENCVVTNGMAMETAGNYLEHCVYLGNGGTIAGTQVCGTTVKVKGSNSQGGIVYVSSGTVTNCQVFANSFRDKNCSALTLDGANALAVDCDVYGNTASGVEYRAAGSGGASILAGGGTLLCCRVTGNANAASSGYNYAGALCVAGGNALVDRCVITNNTSGFNANISDRIAGGVLIYGSATMRNCLVAGNRLTGAPASWTKPFAGGVLVTSAGALVENCTIADNILDGGCSAVAGLRLTAASSVTNCIAWGNGGTPTGGEWTSGNISNETATVTTCWTEDPFFETGSYRLSVSSPCIDAGTNQDWMDGAVDLAGDPRIRNGYVDIGAFESEHIPSYECSIQSTSKLLGPAGGTVPLKAVFTMPTFVESIVWTVTAESGTAPAGGEGTEFNLVCPPGANTYTVSLKVTWNGGREATASEPAIIRVVEKYDVAPGDDLVSVLASLTGLSSANPVTVNLAEGTYTVENSGVAADAEWMYVLEDGVILKGAGVGRTVLDGCLTNRVLRLKAGSKAQDLTVANAHSQGSTVSLRGYALDINGATVENCVVTNGFAADVSGAFLEHCVYLGNGGTIAGTQVCGTRFKQSGYNSQGGVVYISSGTMTNCQVFANSWRDRNCSALTLDGANALAVDCDVYGNTASGVEYRGAGSGGASILTGGGRLVRCRVTGNTNNASSGNNYVGGLCVAGGNALVDRCVITNNASGFNANLTSLVAGGVIICGSATMRNTLVAGNRLTGVAPTNPRTVGGGVLVTSAAAKVENCTIVNNTLDGACCEGSGMRLTAASSIVNCIVWQNGGTPKGGEWMLGNISNVTASVTCTCTSPLIEGEGNIAEGPRLKVKKGYLIKSSSPCVNAGDPTGWTADDVDLLGIRASARAPRSTWAATRPRCRA